MVLKNLHWVLNFLWMLFIMQIAPLANKITSETEKGSSCLPSKIQLLKTFFFTASALSIRIFANLMYTSSSCSQNSQVSTSLVDSSTFSHVSSCTTSYHSSHEGCSECWKLHVIKSDTLRTDSHRPNYRVLASRQSWFSKRERDKNATCHEYLSK